MGKYFVLFIFLIVVHCFSLQAQSLVVKGTVEDSETKEKLAFATVGIRNSKIGSITNSSGSFEFSLPVDYKDSVLQVSYMGYKNSFIPVKQCGKFIPISLERDIVELDQVEVRPWSAWDYIENALSKVGQNYNKEPYMSDGYFNKGLYENGDLIRYTEAVVESYNPAFQDTTARQCRLVQARNREGLRDLVFMRGKLEKEKEKEYKKARKNGENVQEMDDDILNFASMMDPSSIMKINIIRDTISFLNKEKRKYFSYTIDGYTSYNDKDVVIIRAVSKKTLNHYNSDCKIYIDLESDAFVAFDLNIKLIIPDLVKPVLFLAGYGITDPVFSGSLHYKPIEGVWYMNDLNLTMQAKITKKKLFKKNEYGDFFFETNMIEQEIGTKNVSPIPRSERINFGLPLYKQIEEDKDFWENYKVSRPSKIEIQ